MTAKQDYKHQLVLLVDDNEIDNMINERMIVTSSFSRKVVTKKSCDEAIQYLKQISAPSEAPSLIFLDLNMPEKDGFDFLKEYDELEPTLKSAIRVVVLSSSISQDDITKASTNPNVIRYLNKPLSVKYLEAIQY